MIATGAKKSRTELLRRAIDDLEWGLGPGIARIQKSTCGIMLERAKLYAYAAEHRLDTKPKRVPPRNSDCIPIKRESSEPSYEIDGVVLERLSRALRIMDAVGRISPESAMALSLLYGDSGYRWGSSSLANREIAVWPLTPSGRALASIVRSQFSTRADELLANEVALQKRQPNDIRRKKLERIERETSDMVERAHAVLAEVVCMRAGLK